MSATKSVIKRVLLAILVVLIGFCLYYGEEIVYGISQGKGQLEIVWNSKPIEEVLEDPQFPDSLKSKLLLIQEIRQFTIDSLGLNPSENYTTLYDQKGKPILWALTASAPYELKAKEWKFPFLGSFTYKGFFDLEKAKKQEQILKEEGWDTVIDEVSGWSTLGWFKDPILSSMLTRKPGSLSNLIIHELTHGTLYVKNNIQFNENLANFVGHQGALMFLESKYGTESSQYQEYVKGRKFVKEYRERVLMHASRLDSLYASIANLDEIEKKRLKELQINGIRQDLIDFLKINGRLSGGIPDEIQHLNNTYFFDFRRYNEDQEQFEAEFDLKFGRNLKNYIRHLKSLYPSL